MSPLYETKKYQTQIIRFKVMRGNTLNTNFFHGRKIAKIDNLFKISYHSATFRKPSFNSLYPRNISKIARYLTGILYELAYIIDYEIINKLCYRSYMYY